MRRLLATGTLLAMIVIALVTTPNGSSELLPPPGVLLTTPADGTTGVSHFVRPSVTFTQPMDGASINRSTFTIAPKGGAPLLANVAYSPVSGLAFIAPLAPLDYSKTYVLTLSKEVKGLDGTPLPAPFSWELTTSGAGYVKRLESGGAAYGPLAYEPEGSFVKGGLTRVSTNPIAGTEDDLVYQTERYGLWSYVFSVPNGTYTVRTHHAETLKTGPGQRVFGIDVLETPGVDAPSIDLWSLARQNTAYVREFTVTTATSRVQVRATAVAGDPQISAIELVAQSPRVTSTSPAAGATGVSPNAVVRAAFSRAMDGTSVTPETFTLSGPEGPVEATVSYDPGTRVATLAPSAPLSRGTTYTTSISGDVRASDGMCPSAAAGWSFTTG